MFRQMKKAGIIGGLEFIGSYITLKFLSENYQVKVPVSKFQNREKVLTIPGLETNKYFEKFYGDLSDLSEIRKFACDCNVIIHCGSPFSLNQLSSNPQLFVPEIRGTGSLLKVLSEYPNIQKLIIISPPTDLNSSFLPSSQQVKMEPKTPNPIIKNNINLHFQKAEFHAKKAHENALQTLEEKRFEVIFVSPAEVLENTLISNNDATSTGLRYLFENGINHDPVFKGILHQIKLQTLINAEDAAETVFFKVNSIKTEKRIKSMVG
jgi:nucleoside-diphosphate-sugar epimerase